MLQYGDIQRVGDDRSLRVDVRVLAATNRDLREEVLAGNFRADLFHRLSVFPLTVPPLRGARMWCCWRAFLRTVSAQNGAFPRGAKPRCEDAPAELRLAGNVRELEHAIHRAVVLARATRSGMKW